MEVLNGTKPSTHEISNVICKCISHLQCCHLKVLGNVSVSSGREYCPEIYQSSSQGNVVMWHRSAGDQRSPIEPTHSEDALDV